MATREQRCPDSKADQDPEGQQEATHQSQFGPSPVEALQHRQVELCGTLLLKFYVASSWHKLANISRLAAVMEDDFKFRYAIR
jgi:hypothetical protein